MGKSTLKLEQLSGGNFKPADPAEDVRGRTVLDVWGATVGTVDDLLIDKTHEKVRLIRVVSAGFLGMGQNKFLIPVNAIVRVEDDAVHIDHSRTHVTSAPAYRPGPFDEEYLGDLFAHYGHVPFWHLK